MPDSRGLHAHPGDLSKELSTESVENSGLSETDPVNDAQRLAQQVSSLREQGVRHAKLGFTDVDGVLRGKYLSVDKLEGLVDGAAGFCDCVLGWDVNDVLYDDARFTGWHTGFPDAQYRLDPATLRTLPGEGTAFWLADFVAAASADASAGTDRDHALHPICPRSRLKSVLERAAELGFGARMGFEYEFFVFRETPASVREKGYRDLTPLTPGNFGYSILRASSEGERFRGLLDYTEALGTPLEGLHCETGPGVWEGALAVADALEAADRANLFKTFSKVHLAQQDLMATFMARWSMDYPGQSGHVHVSLVDESGRSLFHDAGAERGIGALQRQFVAGLEARMGELAVMFAPTINSYTRLVPGYWAPTGATWGVENRTCAIRVIPGSAKSQRVEFRAAGADANPYLAAAAILAAGLSGIEEGLEPSDAVAGNAYEIQDGLPPERRLPTNLRDAAKRFRASTIARRWFGDDFVDHFTTSRLWEVREYERHVDDWQLSRYFEII